MNQIIDQSDNGNNDVVIDVSPVGEPNIEVLSADPRDIPPLPALRPSTQQGGVRRFDYGFTKIDDIHVATSEDPKKKQKKVDHLLINDEPFVPTPRFWGSLQTLYGFSNNIFDFFSHKEVFDRVSERRSNDRLRFCVQREPNQPPRLLAATRPEKAIITYDTLMDTIHQYGGEGINFLDGLVNSTHTPRIGGDHWAVGPDALVNRFCLEVPVDGYGKPSVFLSCIRLVCDNGAIARTPAFRTELNIGKGDDVVQSAVIRALDSFNSDEGYSALKDRFNVAAKSWASVQESTSLYKILIRMHSQDEILGNARTSRGPDSIEAVEQKGSPIITRFHEVTGDTTRLYGLANLDALSIKRQRTLPVKCTVYDLINFATEVATHTSTERGRQTLHGWVGRLIGDESGYDMEGCKETWDDFDSFFLQTDLRDVKKLSGS